MLTFGLLALSFFSASASADDFTPIQTIPWHEASIFQVNTDTDIEVEQIVDRYLANLARRGFATSQQGIYIQSEWATLADNRGKIPAPAASLTKVATTIASLQTWELNHRFDTKFYATAEVTEGVVDGDLIILAEGDPLFVWEEAISVGNHLEKLGIQKITGDLVVIGNWQMNYKTGAIQSAKLFKQALNSKQWTSTIEKQYQTIKPTIPRPQVTILGNVKTLTELPNNNRLLLTHQSLTLKEILRLMNVYSNNYIAESLAQQIGGGEKVGAIAAKVANVPTEEVLLINGSGLGVNNRISPRAASSMFMALDIC